MNKRSLWLRIPYQEPIPSSRQANCLQQMYTVWEKDRDIDILSLPRRII